MPRCKFQLFEVIAGFLWTLETVMAALKNLDKDHWAEEWSKIGWAAELKGRRCCYGVRRQGSFSDSWHARSDAYRVGFAIRTYAELASALPSPLISIRCVSEG